MFSAALFAKPRTLTVPCWRESRKCRRFEQATISAESALEATQAGFEVGTRTIVDVLIAEQRKYQAQRDNSVARHAYIIRHLRLKSDRWIAVS